jgi:hypothetical protein
VILHPPILALIIGSLLTSLMLVYAAGYGVSVLRNWDLTSGSELQLGLERKTYLISTLVSYAFGFQLLSLFLFVYTAEDICHLFVGAMCAAGTLDANPYGYPALLLKIVDFLLAGIWLIVNYVDNKAYDYPLIKKKYLLLLLIMPLMLCETGLLIRYFQKLSPNIITSCCSTLFSGESGGSGADLEIMSNRVMVVLFSVAMGLTLITGFTVYFRRGRGGYLFALLTGGTFVISIMALISVLALYFYELPTHHCPFCILQRNYNFVGYPLYLALFGGGVTGIGTGVLALFRKTPSLVAIIPVVQRRLALTTVICYALFTAIVFAGMIFSNLTLG